MRAVCLLAKYAYWFAARDLGASAFEALTVKEMGFIEDNRNLPAY